MTDSHTHDTPDTTEQQEGGISITHTNDDGTLVEGTARGDGSRDALRAAGCRWSRNVGAWYMPQSRGNAPWTDRIDLLAASLRDAGFPVDVEIEEYDAAAAFAARQEAREQRGQRLSDRAARERGLGDAHDQRAHDAVADIPVGQAVAAGPNGNWHRSAISRSHVNMAVAGEHHANATSAQERSDAARRQVKRRESPVVMGRKLQRLEADERSLKRTLETASGEYADRTRERLGFVQADLVFLRDAIEKTGVRKYTKDDFKKGDLALIRGRWEIVRKANPKTLACESGYSWSDNYPYLEVTGRRPAPGAADAV
jgi:hypothetical protein